MLQCVAVRCSVLQCVAVCCSVLQCVAVCYLHSVSASIQIYYLCIHIVCRSVLQRASAYYCELQCVTLYFSVLQCVVCFDVSQCVAVYAVCCSVLQCVAVCCSGCYTVL